MSNPNDITLSASGSFLYVDSDGDTIELSRSGEVQSIGNDHDLTLSASGGASADVRTRLLSQTQLGRTILAEDNPWYSTAQAMARK